MSVFKNKRGVIPIFILIGIILVVAAGGAIAVRQAFKNKSAKDKATVENVIKKVENPNLGPIELNADNNTNPPPNQTTGQQDTPSNVVEEDKPQTPGEPGFKIFPPAGWIKTSTSAKNAVAYFEAPEQDEQKVENGIFHLKANIVVRRKKADAGETVDSLVSGIKSEASYNCKSASFPTDTQANINGTAAHRLELVCDLDKFTAHSYGYYMIVNGYEMFVTGSALDSAWGQRAGQIKSSVDTFSITQ